MSIADWVVIGVVALSGLYGLTRGLVRGVLSLAGFGAGAYLGALVVPALLSEGSRYAPVIALAGALLVGSVLSALAGLLGGTLRATLGAIPGLKALDSFAGAALGVAAGVFLSWAVGAVLLYLPGQSELRRAVQESEILGRINDEFPPERLLETLGRVDPLDVLLGPEAVVPPPDFALAGDPQVIAASKSVVRVTGIACGLGVQGSGWIAQPGVVVTNAHVVAGIEFPRVARDDGSEHTATVVVFDVDNDLAVLRVPELRGAPLPLGDTQRGVPVALVGYPENGPLTRTPGRLGATQELVTRDAYGRESVTRPVTAIRGAVRPGNSGGPAVDAQGSVRATIFARRPRETGGYGIPAEVVRAALRKAGSKPVPATGCTR